MGLLAVDRRLAGGRVTAGKTVRQIAETPHIRSEKDEQRLCDSFMLRASWEVICFSQPHEASGMTLGIADRRYRRPAQAFWWEVKTEDPKSKLSREQEAFLLGEIAAGQWAGCGTLDDLIEYHASMLSGYPLVHRMNQRELIARWVLKGYRPTPKSRRRRHC